MPRSTAKKMLKIGGKEGLGKKPGKKLGKREKNGKKRQKSGRFFHFAPPDSMLTDRAGYASVCRSIKHCQIIISKNNAFFSFL